MASIPISFALKFSGRVFNFKEILSVSLILFSVIDILGSVPIIIDLRKKAGHVQSEKATLASGLLMVLFLFLGESILKLFGIDIGSFAIAGGLIMFFIGLEMVLNINQKTAADDLAEDVLYRCFSKGLSFKITMGNVLTLSPPLIITRKQIDLSLKILDQCIDEAEKAACL